MNAIDWMKKAEEQGYSSEQQMWEEMYKTHSISQIAKLLKVAHGTVRLKLKDANITLKSRGGANSNGSKLDPNLMEDVLKYGVAKAALIRKVRPQAIYQRLYYRFGLSVMALKKQLVDMELERLQAAQSQSEVMTEEDHEG
jgi:hypothetical protein